ncbi:MAG TPA: ABC transporter permease [Streptosporangiaceae bacterium]|nr:ABC transporter permease [Streptosporangiaceae bacterium]
MSVTADKATTPPGGPARVDRRQWTRLLATASSRARGRLGLALTAVVVLIAALGPRFAPYSATQFVTTPFSRPSAHHLLGGDDLGRDVLSRLLAGGWVLLVMAVAATAIGLVLGTLAGVCAAYLRGRWDGIIMRTVDVILAFPTIVFALLLVSVVGPKLWLIVLAVGISHAPQVARVMRAATLEISERDFVKAVELWGIRSWTVMRSEVLPNLSSPLMVELGLRLTYSIVIISGLSFLGFSQPPPAPNWGLMINENRLGLVANPWSVVAPALLIALLTIGTNTFTDAVGRLAIGVGRGSEETAVVAGLAGAVMMGELQQFPLDEGVIEDPEGADNQEPAVD